jgi:hypothetical protein
MGIKDTLSLRAFGTRASFRFSPDFPRLRPRIGPARESRLQSFAGDLRKGPEFLLHRRVLYKAHLPLFSLGLHTLSWIQR